MSKNLCTPEVDISSIVEDNGSGVELAVGDAVVQLVTAQGVVDIDVVDPVVSSRSSPKLGV